MPLRGLDDGPDSEISFTIQLLSENQLPTGICIATDHQYDEQCMMTASIVMVESMYGSKQYILLL